MNITTWNVNGFRSVIGKGFVEWVSSYKPDVLCLQEIKVKEDQIPNIGSILPEYKKCWFPAEKPGYSGVASFSLNDIKFGKGMQKEEFDKEGRVITAEIGNIILFNIYFPNGQRDYERLNYKLSFYDYLLTICNKYHQEGKNIIITGDFNTAHNEIDLANPKENSKTSGFLPEERAWIDKYLENGFIDAYRNLYPDKVEYTWWTYRFGARKRNIGWRLDYFLVSNGIINRIKDVIVHNEVEGSDHCPVSLVIDI